METNILNEAKELLNGDRAVAYGDPIDNFKNIADVANVLLKRKGIVLDREAVAMILVALKVAREGHKHSTDNLVDAAAYLQLMEIVMDKPIQVVDG